MNPDSCRVHVTMFRNVKSKRGTPAPMLWPALREVLSSHSARGTKDGPTWSPASYPQNANRAAKNVDFVSLLVFDVDDSPFNEAIRERWAPLEYFAHSSYSHTAEAPRWRAVFPLARPVAGDRWRDVFLRAVKALADGIADKSCCDASRLFYLPSCPADTLEDAFAHHNSGELLDPDSLPVLETAPRVPAPAHAARPLISIDRTDDDLLATMFASKDGAKWRELWEGQWEGHAPSQSEADLALCNTLAFYTARDAERMDRLFRQCGLMREKWDRAMDDGTYGSCTVRKACLGTESTYTPKRRRSASTDTPARSPDERPQLVLRSPEPEGNGHVQRDAEAILALASEQDVVGASDHENAQRFVAIADGALVWTPGHSWLEWAGTHWRRDEGAGLRLARRIGPALLRAATLPQAEGALRNNLADAGRKALASAKMSNAVTLARVDLALRVEDELLDRDPWLLACGPTTVNLQTGESWPARPEDYITRNTHVDFDPDAKCPVWEAVLERILPDRELRGFVWRALGYSLTGRTGERALFVLHGGGRNGKSTLLGTIQSVMGDYAAEVSPDVFLVSKEIDERSAVKLWGKRLISAGETEDGKRLRESFIKRATGQDRMDARRLFAEAFDFVPECKMWLATNHQPRITGTDAALWDRVRLIPFAERLTEDEVDKDLRDKLAVERAGILAWAIAGCAAWVKSGLATPQAVKAATVAYQEGEDTFGEWFRERVVEDGGGEVPFGELYADYVAFCDNSGERPARKRSFGTALDERGIDSGRGSRNVSVRLGIALRGS